ncbi:MAG: SIMPL domain-containing protein [Lachnospiraceae bacterium]|nr:SIMPL domain-containing protein [Lachnospiraceae bacterium]
MEENNTGNTETEVTSNKPVTIRPVKTGIGWGGVLIICLSVIIAAGLLAFGLSRFRSVESHTIGATGSASVDFESDLIIWRGTFNTHAYTTDQAFRQIKDDAASVKKYLIDNGIKEDEIVLSSISVSQAERDVYSDDGEFRYSEFDGYDLWQTITVTSGDIDKVEKVSRDVTDLLESGIEFDSDLPEYYCTTLDDVKLDLIGKATENARDRIDIIAQAAGAVPGKLVNSNLGVFQIVAKNSGTQDYTYDGAFDTSSRWKTASITVKLEYELK